MNTIFYIVVILTVYFTSVNSSYSSTVTNCAKAGIKNNSKNKLFFKFIHKYDKHYKTKRECLERFRAFKGTLRSIKSVKEGMKGVGKYGITYMSDYIHKGRKTLFPTNVSPSKGAYFQGVPKKIPESWDWRKRHVVNPVRDANNCISSYAFSIVGNAESVFAVRTGKLYQLSPQQIVDCDHMSSLCNNGNIEFAAKYISRLGAMTEHAYPYVAKNQTCAYDRKQTVLRPKRVDLVTGNEEIMAQYLYEHGPVAAFVNANCLSMYKGGIFYDINSYNSKMFPQSLLLVGYGVKKYGGNTTLPYWIARNSVGAKWGEKGDVRLVRGNGMCMINTLMVSVVF